MSKHTSIQVAAMLAMCVMSLPAHAEWTKVNENESEVTFLDFSTIRKEGDIAKVWVLNNHKRFRSIENVGNSLSSKDQYLFNCRKELTAIAYRSEFTKHHGAGEPLASATFSDRELDWRPLPPGSVVMAISVVACAKK